MKKNVYINNNYDDENDNEHNESFREYTISLIKGIAPLAGALVLVICVGIYAEIQDRGNLIPQKKQRNQNIETSVDDGLRLASDEPASNKITMDSLYNFKQNYK